MKALRVTNWNLHFENNRTRELKMLDWFPVPNKHDGYGYNELISHQNGMAHYAAWMLILAVASKSQPRGTLLRDAATPHDARSLAVKTRGSAKIFEEAIPRLVDVGWLEWIELTHSDKAVSDDAAASCGKVAPECGKVPIEGKGMEGNRKEGKEIDRYPAWEQVKARASMAGIPEAEAEKFWHHYESMGWIDKNGNPILKWEHKLAVWGANAREQKHKDRVGSGAQTERPPSIFALKAKREALEELARQIKFKHCSEVAAGEHWDNQEERKRYRGIKQEIKQLIERMTQCQ